MSLEECNKLCHLIVKKIQTWPVEQPSNSASVISSIGAQISNRIGSMKSDLSSSQNGISRSPVPSFASLVTADTPSPPITSPTTLIREDHRPLLPAHTSTTNTTTNATNTTTSTNHLTSNGSSNGLSPLIFNHEYLSPSPVPSETELFVKDTNVDCNGSVGNNHSGPTNLLSPDSNNNVSLELELIHVIERLNVQAEFLHENAVLYDYTGKQVNGYFSMLRILQRFFEYVIYQIEKRKRKFQEFYEIACLLSRVLSSMQEYRLKYLELRDRYESVEFHRHSLFHVASPPSKSIATNGFSSLDRVDLNRSSTSLTDDAIRTDAVHSRNSVNVGEGMNGVRRPGSVISLPNAIITSSNGTLTSAITAIPSTAAIIGEVSSNDSEDDEDEVLDEDCEFDNISTDMVKLSSDLATSIESMKKLDGPFGMRYTRYSDSDLNGVDMVTSGPTTLSDPSTLEEEEDEEDQGITFAGKRSSLFNSKSPNGTMPRLLQKISDYYSRNEVKKEHNDREYGKEIRKEEYEKNLSKYNRMFTFRMNSAQSPTAEDQPSPKRSQLINQKYYKYFDHLTRKLEGNFSFASKSNDQTNNHPPTILASTATTATNLTVANSVITINDQEPKNQTDQDPPGLINEDPERAKLIETEAEKELRRIKLEEYILSKFSDTNDPMHLITPPMLHFYEGFTLTLNCEKELGLIYGRVGPFWYCKSAADVVNLVRNLVVILTSHPSKSIVSLCNTDYCGRVFAHRQVNATLDSLVHGLASLEVKAYNKRYFKYLYRDHVIYGKTVYMPVNSNFLIPNYGNVLTRVECDPSNDCQSNSSVEIELPANGMTTKHSTKQPFFSSSNNNLPTMTATTPTTNASNESNFIQPEVEKSQLANASDHKSDHKSDHLESNLADLANESKLSDSETNSISSDQTPASRPTEKNIKLVNSRTVRCRLINYARPPNESELCPQSDRCLVFHVHGGGFVLSSPDSHELYLRDWAVKLKGIPILSVDYVLRKRYPSAPQDVLDVYLTLVDPRNQQLVTELIGFGPERIILVGDSAGANLILSLLCCLNEIRHQHADYADLLMPVAMLGIYGAFDIRAVMSPSKFISAIDPILHHGNIMAMIGTYAGIAQKIRKTLCKFEEEHVFIG